MKTLLGRFLLTAQAGSAERVKNHKMDPDIVLPGNIAINLGSRTISKSDAGISINFSEITDASVQYAGQAGCVDNYVLSLKTKRYDNPKLKWRISNIEKDADQVALIVKDVISGEFSPSDCGKLPKSIQALTRQFAGACC